MHASCSVGSDSLAQRTVARQAPLSTGFSRQEPWSGLPCPPPGDLPDQGLNLSPALAGRVFTSEPAGVSYSQREGEKPERYIGKHFI